MREAVASIWNHCCQQTRSWAELILRLQISMHFLYVAHYCQHCAVSSLWSWYAAIWQQLINKYLFKTASWIINLVGECERSYRLAWRCSWTDSQHVRISAVVTHAAAAAGGLGRLWCVLYVYTEPGGVSADSFHFLHRNPLISAL